MADRKHKFNVIKFSPTCWLIHAESHTLVTSCAEAPCLDSPWVSLLDHSPSASGISLQEEEVTTASKAPKHSDTPLKEKKREKKKRVKQTSPPELTKGLHSNCWIISRGYQTSCLGLASSPPVSKFFDAPSFPVLLFLSSSCRFLSSASSGRKTKRDVKKQRK